MAAELTPGDNNGRPLFGYRASVDPVNYYAPYRYVGNRSLLNIVRPVNAPRL